MRTRGLGSLLCGATAGLVLAGCGLQVHTSVSDATAVAQENGSRILSALSSAAREAPDAPALQGAVRAAATGAYEDVETLSPAEFDAERGNLRAAVYEIGQRADGVSVRAYASGTAQGGGLPSSATVYGCFSAQLVPGEWELSYESVPCPKFQTSGSVTEAALTLELPSKPRPDVRQTPGG